MKNGIADKQHIKLTYVVNFYCNKNNISDVESLLRGYERMNYDLLQVIEFVVVDDGSPVLYDIPHLKLNLTWLRIQEDIRWNQGGAKNLGVTYAKSDKIVIIDLDHFIPEHTLRYLVNTRNPGRDFFKIYRKDKDGNLQKGHSNLFFMSRARFLRFYGYDEEFSGDYGAEDFRFVKIQKYNGSRQKYLPKKYYCVSRVLSDESGHSLKRDLTVNTPVDARKKKEILEYGPEAGHSRLFLDFKWTVLKQNNLECPDREAKRMWKYLWWLRWLLPVLSK